MSPEFCLALRRADAIVRGSMVHREGIAMVATKIRSSSKEGASKPSVARKPAPASTTAAAGKRTAAARTVPRPAKGKVSSEQRYCMIAEAAYYRAERRGFSGGNPLQDWVEAEAEIDRLLSQPH